MTIADPLSCSANEHWRELLGTFGPLLNCVGQDGAIF